MTTAGSCLCVGMHAYASSKAFMCHARQIACCIVHVHCADMLSSRRPVSASAQGLDGDVSLTVLVPLAYCDTIIITIIL